MTTAHVDLLASSARGAGTRSGSNGVGPPPPQPRARVVEGRDRGFAIAGVVSVVAHALVALALAAVWLDRGALEEERRRKALEEQLPPPPISFVEAETLEEDAAPAALADQVDPGKEDAAQGHDVVAMAEPRPAAPAPPPPPPPAPVPVKVTPPAPPKPAPKPEPAPPAPVTTEDPVAPVASVTPPSPDPAPAPPGAKASGASSGDVAAAPAPATSAAPAGGTDVGDGGGAAREKAPDLAARFTKELSRYAADIPGWTKVPSGSSHTATVTIELDDRGRVVVPKGLILPNVREPELALSVQRTLSALVTKLALPGHPVRAGTMTVKIRATASDGAERPEGEEIKLETSYDPQTKVGKSSFSLRSGRAVTFEITVILVEPRGADTNASPPTD